MKAAFAILVVSALRLSAQVAGISVLGRSQPLETGKATIQGKVLDGLTREPVRKAQVTLTGRVQLTAVTDVDGHFAFRQLPAGSYFVFAQSEKYPSGSPIDPVRQISVSIASEEDKSVEVALNPGGSLRGHIVDEEGRPMEHCQVSGMQFYYDGTREQLLIGGNSQSDEKGEYRIENLPAGKYYVSVSCPQSLPLPHAFLRRDEARMAPTLVYPQLYYPSAGEPSGAAKVPVTPGSNLTGIDFQMSPETGFTLRGRAHPVQADRRLIVQLRRQGATLSQGQRSVLADTNGEFRIPNVPRGSYELITTSMGEDCGCFAKATVEVGDTVPERIDLPISPAPRITGAVAIEGDTKVPTNNLHIQLIPRDDQMLVRAPQTPVDRDGAFALTAPPGRWRLQVNGAPGYIRSVTMGDREVSPNLETTASPAVLKITISTKLAQVTGAYANLPADGSLVSGMLWSTEETSDYQQSFGMSRDGRLAFTVPPGRYVACGIVAPGAFMLLRNLALRKALESHCATVEVAESDHASVTIPVIAADDFQRLLDSVDGQDSTPPR